MQYDACNGGCLGLTSTETGKDFAYFRNNVLSNLQQGCVLVIFVSLFTCLNKKSNTTMKYCGLNEKQELFSLVMLLPL